MSNQKFESPGDALAHFGVKGMRWGVRKDRRGATRKRQEEFIKKDLKKLNEGGHLSVGATKKRQEALDKRDKARLEKNLQKLQSGKKTKKGKEHEDSKRVKELRKKRMSEMSNDELKVLTQRLQLEQQYRSLHKKDKARGQSFIEEVATATAKNYISKRTTAIVDEMISGKKK